MYTYMVNVIGYFIWIVSIQDMSGFLRFLRLLYIMLEGGNSLLSNQEKLMNPEGMIFGSALNKEKEVTLQI